MTRGFFVTGTDTGIGKTWCSAGLMTRLRQEGYSVAGMKPVASGCEQSEGVLRNEDALTLLSHASITLSYDEVNPFAFEPPVAPHIAAQLAGSRIDFGVIRERFEQLAGRADMTIVEGVGGWRVPLNEQQEVADLAASMALPVVMVVGLRLGCINHALLSAESIRAHGCTLAGWIGNCVEAQMAQQQENIHAIEQRIGAPLLGIVPYRQTFSAGAIAASLTLPAIRTARNQ